MPTYAKSFLYIFLIIIIYIFLQDFFFFAFQLNYASLGKGLGKSVSHLYPLQVWKAFSPFRQAVCERTLWETAVTITQHTRP